MLIKPTDGLFETQTTVNTTEWISLINAIDLILFCQSLAVAWDDKYLTWASTLLSQNIRRCLMASTSELASYLKSTVLSPLVMSNYDQIDKNSPGTKRHMDEIWRCALLSKFSHI